MSREMTSKDKVKLEKLMVKYLDYKEAAELNSGACKEVGKVIQSVLEDAGEKSYSIELVSGDSKVSRAKKYSFIVVTKALITYNVKAVKAAIDKEMFNMIANKDVFIDYDKFVEIAKKYNIPKKVAMSCLNVHESIDNAKLQRLHETGDIDLKKLKGTYTVDKQSYLTVRQSQEK